MNELAEEIEALTKRVERLHRELLKTVKNDPEAKRLTTIPRVGPLIAATVKAVFPDIGFSFARSEILRRWIGLTPGSNSSGGKEKLGSISYRNEATYTRSH